jgi:uncharacterized protein
MNNYKIIFTGPVGAGKSTAIASISDTPPVTTEEFATDITKEIKTTTTVAMDYGVMNLDGGDRLHLYGTPGQQRFDFMWDILTEGSVGLVLLINNEVENPIQDLRFFLDAFSEFIDRTRLVVGVTYMDRTAKPAISDYCEALKQTKHKVPVLEIDARERRDVALLLEALLFTLDPSLLVA